MALAAFEFSAGTVLCTEQSKKKRALADLRIVYAQNEANYCAKYQTEGRLLADRSLSRLLKDRWPKTGRLRKPLARSQFGGGDVHAVFAFRHCLAKLAECAW